MVELFSLDDVGQCYDLALGERRSCIGVTLGRHINDEVTSFYSNSPSGFMFEYGWGGRVIDVDNWQTEEVTWGPSMWGHDRMWMTPEKRAEARELRIEAAATGLRKPVNVIEGNYNRMPGSARGGTAWCAAKPRSDALATARDATSAFDSQIDSRRGAMTTSQLRSLPQYFEVARLVVDADRAAARSSPRTCRARCTGFIRLGDEIAVGRRRQPLCPCRAPGRLVDQLAGRGRLDVAELADLAMEGDMRQLELEIDADRAR